MKEILPLLPALIHIYIFVLESFLWGRNRTNKIFGIRTEEDAAITKPLAFNQGFYNLFLAVAIIGGIYLRQSYETSDAGTALIMYALTSIFAAGAVLLLSNRKLWRGAMIQMVPAVIALIPYCLP